MMKNIKSVPALAVLALIAMAGVAAAEGDGKTLADAVGQVEAGDGGSTGDDAGVVINPVFDGGSDVADGGEDSGTSGDGSGGDETFSDDSVSFGDGSDAGDEGGEEPSIFTLGSGGEEMMQNTAAGGPEVQRGNHIAAPGVLPGVVPVADGGSDSSDCVVAARPVKGVACR